MSERVTATGFVVGGQANSVLIATSYHVIQGGDSFGVVFESGAKLMGLDVVKVDVENDIALLEAASLGRVDGLEFSPTLELGQRVGVIGYPYLPGEKEPSLTFEDGAVTNKHTEMGGRTFIRTNANFNFGNSGGPVVDGCGRVIGIVASMHKETARTGLVVPVQKLSELLGAYRAPRKAVAQEIEASVKQLENSVQYGHGADVARMFSRGYLTRVVQPHFKAALEKDVKKAEDEVTNDLRQRKASRKPVIVSGHVITDVNALPKEDRQRILREHLKDNPSLQLLDLIAENKVDPHTAMQMWLGLFTQRLFGRKPSFAVEKLESGSEKAARSDVMVRDGEQQTYYVFGWIYEWGDWRIDTLECVRGCLGSD